MKQTIAIVGAFDTKGEEYRFVADLIEQRGHSVLKIDFGTQGSPRLKPDVTSAEIATAGGAESTKLQDLDRGSALSVMGDGLVRVLPSLHAQGKFQAVLALGGTGGTSVACAGMRALPLGVPKVMVSTAAGADVTGYVGTKDITMVPSIVDVAGINSISRGVFARAAGAVCGMLEQAVPTGVDKPLVVASMFGNTTAAVTTAQKILEASGYEVLVFHCTGQGGRVMEELVASGMIKGVLDLTTTELADELVGGVFSAGPHRLEAAASQGIPAIVVPGCLDMVNFRAPETIPETFSGRTFYRHNDNVTLMRTTVEENRRLGEILAKKVSRSSGEVTVLLPLRGLSMIDGPGGDFHDPEATSALFESIEANVSDEVTLLKMDNFINDEEFAAACAQELIRLMARDTHGEGND